MHGIPMNYTKGFPERTRHKWVANSWHIGIAKILMLVLLLQAPRTEATPIPTPRHLEQYPGLRAVQHLWKGQGAPMHHPEPPWTASQQLELETDMWTHWRQATQLGDPRHEAMQIEPGLQTTLEMQCSIQDVCTLRDRVCQDLQQLKEDLRSETALWWTSLPPHVRELYQSEDLALQVPMMEHLNDLLGWQDPELMHELSMGFPMLGSITPGLGWPKRSDSKYVNPTSTTDFLQHNQHYIENKLKRHRVDDHWKEMLTEIAADVKAQRMTGPYHGPPCWPKKMVGVADFDDLEELMPGMPEHQPTSVSFSILQTGSDGRAKVRRGEDWRRSGHNATISVSDGPVNHRPDTFVASAKFLQAHGKQPWLWGTDQEAAYRQLPVDLPDTTWMLLFTPYGPTYGNIELYSSELCPAYGHMADALTT